MRLFTSRDTCLTSQCDWLWRCGDVVGIWQRAIRRSGLSASEAGLLCISLALPAYILGRDQAPLYRLPISTEELHGRLFDISRTLAEPDPRTLDDLAHYSAMIDYQVFSGQHGPFLVSCSQAAATAIRDKGWMDEGRPVWAALDLKARERARLLIRNIANNYQSVNTHVQLYQYLTYWL